MQFVTMADLSGLPDRQGVGLIQEEWPVLGPTSFYEAGPGAEFVEKAFQGLGQVAKPTTEIQKTLERMGIKRRHQKWVWLGGATIVGIVLWAIGSTLSK